MRSSILLDPEVVAVKRGTMDVQALIRSTGRKIDFYKTHALARRIKLMESHEIGLVLDVGANTGQYAKILRKAGYRGDIVSFEPLSGAFSRLQRSAARDRRWQAVRLALGDRDGETTIHISGDSQASSLRKMLPLHEDIAPYFSSVGQEQVTLRRLDAVWGEYASGKVKVFLKIDTQGFEKQVLSGASRSLRKIQGVQLELSIAPLYQGSQLLPEMLRFMSRQGFTLMSLEYGFCHPETGQMLQVDGIFFRS